MSTDAPPAQEGAGSGDSIDPVDELEFSPKTGRRAIYEAFDFERAGDAVRVTNESHGDESDEHTYTVELDARDVPRRCTCPAHEYHHAPEGEVCKHALAVALHADEIEDQAVATDGGEVIEAGDEGEVLDEDGEEDADSEDGRPDDCDCAPFLADADLPCWPCYREGFEEPNPAALEDGDDE